VEGADVAAQPVAFPWSLRFPADLWRDLKNHLFPGDGDEHGAVIGATVLQTSREVRLLARRLYPAIDGLDYVAGDYGYRKLTAEFVRDRVLDCRDEGLAYLAIHCHGGLDQVNFSSDDLASHERGYPALVDVLENVVGGLVFAKNAVAGDLWLTDGHRVPLASAIIVSHPLIDLRPAIRTVSKADTQYDRQARLFGDRGQELLSNQKVAVIGAGGAGSLILELLARLGVGHIVAIDPDVVDVTNVPRIVGSSERDAVPYFTDKRWPALLRTFGQRFARAKVVVARRVARNANPRVRFDAVPRSVVDESVARGLTDCDYIFLAADTMQARLIFNAIVHQYCIPGVQVGAKIPTDPDTGEVLDVFSVVRSVTPGHGCLWCNGLISTTQLQQEALSDNERRGQRYVEDHNVVAPSVITLNAVAAAHAVNDYLFDVTGLRYPDSPPHYTRYLARAGATLSELPRRDNDCIECGDGKSGRLSAGPSRSLPTRA
jgi:tRNA A37 threonylcarbamoyladenosine dehydratase